MTKISNVQLVYTTYNHYRITRNKNSRICQGYPRNCRVAFLDFEPIVQGGCPVLPLGFSLPAGT